VAGDDKERLLQGARALLTPLRWDEPGATAVVEALTRGVAVVGSRRGVLPALVSDGVNGFLADDEEGLVRALARVDEIEPDACRASAAGWTPEAMAKRYIELYAEVLDRV